MILSDRDILRSIQLNEIIINPLDKNDVQPSSVDLHLSGHIKYITQCEKIDLSDPEKVIKNRDVSFLNDMKIFLDPGMFILGSTIEHIEIPTDICARVEGKSSFGRAGLAVHITAGFIDPGFKGNITLELRNLGPATIILKPGTQICQICFIKLTSEVLRPYGHPSLNSKYQDSVGTVSYRTKTSNS